MVAHINFAKRELKYISQDISVKNSASYSTNDYLGGEGSNTTYVSSTGRKLSFKMVIPAYAESEQGYNNLVQDYMGLFQAYKKKPAVLTSQSNLNLKGNYLFTEFDITEDTGGNYECSCEFTEVTPFNATKKTFRVWGNVSSSNKAKKTTKKTKPFELNTTLDSNSKILITKCGILKKLKTDKVFICVKRLQKFLQKQGFYTKYKIDGKYGKQTFNAVKSLQTVIGLKNKGKWVTKVQKNKKGQVVKTSKHYVQTVHVTGYWDEETILFMKKAFNLYEKSDLLKEFEGTKIKDAGKVSNTPAPAEKIIWK